jgi:hypothetical protein
MELGALKNTPIRSARMSLKVYNAQHTTRPCGLERQLIEVGFDPDTAEIIIMERNSSEFGPILNQEEMAKIYDYLKHNGGDATPIDPRDMPARFEPSADAIILAEEAQ